MALRFLGKWDKSPDGDSPSLWLDEETGEVILQGWKIQDPAVLAELLASAGSEAFPENETVIRFPADMVALLRKAVEGDGAGSGGR